MSEHGTGNNPTRSDPGRRLVVVVPNDDTVFSITPRALYVGTGGDLAVVGIDDAAPVVLTAVPSGMLLPVSVSKVRATGTTASNIVAIL